MKKIRNRAVKIRIEPTDEQIELFNKTFGCCRKYWNSALADSIFIFKETGELKINTPAYYKNEFEFLKEVDCLALCNTQINLQQAYKNHLDKNRKSRTKHPKFKSKKHGKRSYTTNLVNNNIKLIDNQIKLPKVGNVKAIIHRKPDTNWKLKSVTISQDVDGKWYASLLFEFEKDIEININPDINNTIGIDYKSDGLYIDSNNNKPAKHKYYRENHKKLKKQQRKLARKIGNKKKENKSNNYLKQLDKVNRIHVHIKNARKDFLHKLSTEIANQYDIICVESLNMKAIGNKKFHNGKSTYDNGYGLFITMLEYKMEDRGKYLIKVDKFYPSSKTCSNCGNIKDIKLNERTYECENCGIKIDRDLNAAINIKKEGLRQLEEILKRVI